MGAIDNKISFILELEKLKGILRQTSPLGLDRRENSAEHSWQAAMAALVLLDEAGEGVEPLKVLKMMLIHDIVEIDAGDVFTYDEAARAAVAAQEEAAARRIFGMLDDDIGQELLALWLEFEACQTPSAQFAKAVDCICPCLQNIAGGGQSWVKHGISRQRVIAKNSKIKNASPKLWQAIENQIMESPDLKDDS